MASAHKQTGDFVALDCCRKRILSMVATVALAMVLGIAAAAAINIQHASAQSAASNGANLVNNPDVGAEPAPRSVSGAVYVWAGMLTVGDATNSEAVRLGYVPDPDGQNSTGSLRNKTFSYGGVDYKLQALYYEQTADDVERLVLKANKPLPTHLRLFVGSARFLVAESDASECDCAAHVWTLDRDLGWTAGETMYLALLEPTREEIEQGLVGRVTASIAPDFEG